MVKRKQSCWTGLNLCPFQLVYVSMGASRPSRTSSGSGRKLDSEISAASLIPAPPRACLPVTLLLQHNHFEALFSLMQSLSEIRATGGPAGHHTKAQVLSRRVWDILMLLPTHPEFLTGLQNLGKDFSSLLDPTCPQKLMYSLVIVEALVKLNSASM